MAGLDYRVVDRSILLPHYKRWLVEPVIPHLPASLDPNAITHAGHVLNLAGTVLLWVIGIEHAWACIAAAIGLQAYLWCDNADGAHARRTGQTSTYGEFLDHGLDQLNTVYIGCLTALALDAPPDWFVATVLLTSGAAAVTYWEQSVTGVFRLGLLNQVESLTVLTIALVVTALLGPEVWRTTIVAGIALQAALLGWMTVTILVGVVRALYRVALDQGPLATTPIAQFIGLSALVVGVALSDAVTWWIALAVAAALNIYYGMRMLSLRLSRLEPGIEPVVLAGALVLTVVLLAPRFGWTAVIPAPGAMLGLAAALLVLAVRETRRGLAQLGSGALVLLALAADLCLPSVALAQRLPALDPKCRSMAEVEAMHPGGVTRTAIAPLGVETRGPLFQLTFPGKKDAPLVASADRACVWSPSGAMKLGLLAPITTATAAAAWVRAFEDNTVLEYPWPVLEVMGELGARIVVPAKLEAGVTLAGGVARASIVRESGGAMTVLWRSYPVSGKLPDDVELSTFSPPVGALSRFDSGGPMPVRKADPEAIEAHDRAMTRLRNAMDVARRPVQVGDRDAAQKHLAEGRRLHQRRRFVEAAAALTKAVEADPTHGQAHYALARALGRARAAKRVCEADAYKSRILAALESALRFSPGLRGQMMLDPDLRSARDTYGWQRLAGRTRDKAHVLRSVSWMGPPQGAFGPVSGVQFKQGGRYSAWVKVIGDAGVRLERTGGRWTVDGSKVRMEPDVKQASALTGALLDEGRLVFDEDFGPFSDDPAECAA